MPGSDDWCTPQWLVNAIGECDLDPCSNSNSLVKATRKVQLPEDGLSVDWSGKVFVNPPYSKPLPWAKKAAESLASQRDNSLLMLLRLDPTTRWFRVLVEAEFQFFALKERMQFVGAPGKANFCSVLAAYGGWADELCYDLEHAGKVYSGWLAR